ncbi:unnamed protein product [Merluccius merluccius]
MVTALRRLHAGKVREDGRVEIPSFDGQAAYHHNEVQEETSEIISFADSASLDLDCSQATPTTATAAAIAPRVVTINTRPVLVRGGEEVLLLDVNVAFVMKVTFMTVSDLR